VIKIPKVLLTKTIDSLGRVGEVVDVAEGYARNYLFPRRLAVEPTPHNVARYAKQKATAEAELEERRIHALKLRDALVDHTFVFVRKAHDDDRLYGSVRAEDLATRVEEILAERVDPSKFTMDRPIETVGPHTVTLTLHRDVAVEVRVRVDKEGQEGG
jgi:large subunit ribosomal protein L9